MPRSLSSRFSAPDKTVQSDDSPENLLNQVRNLLGLKLIIFNEFILENYFFSDAILDEVKDDKSKKDQKTEQENIDETVAKCKWNNAHYSLINDDNYLITFSVLQKAGRHMEDTLIAAYVTLIIGYLIKDEKV